MSSFKSATNVSETELSESSVGHAVARGIVLGVPSVFLAVLAVSLLGGAALGNALSLSAVPAIFAGPYFGTLMLLSRAEERQHVAEVAELTARHTGGSEGLRAA